MCLKKKKKKAENLILRKELEELDQELNKHRDSLTRAKHERDELRNDITQTKQRTGFSSSDLLLRDYEQREVSFYILYIYIFLVYLFHFLLYLSIFLYFIDGYGICTTKTRRIKKQACFSNITTTSNAKSTSGLKNKAK